MNKLLGSACVVAAFGAIASPANAQLAGYASASAGQIRIDDNGSNSAKVTGFDASVVAPVGGLILQTNLSYADLASLASNVQASMNLGVRNQNWAAAGYLALRDQGIVEDTSGIIGAEGLYYLNSITFSLGAGVGKSFDEGIESSGVQGEMRYFVSDNVRLDLGVGYNKIDDGVTETDGPALNLGGEWRFDNQPFSIFAEVGGQQADNGGTDQDIYTVGIGLRYDFSTNTLKARDRQGPAFKSAAGFGTPVNFLF